MDTIRYAQDTWFSGGAVLSGSVFGGGRFQDLNLRRESSEQRGHVNAAAGADPCCRTPGGPWPWSCSAPTARSGTGSVAASRPELRGGSAPSCRQGSR